MPFLYLLTLKVVTPIGLGRTLALVLVLVANYPERLDTLAASLPYATVTKRVASLLAIGVPLVLLGFKSVRGSAATAPTIPPSAGARR